MVGILERFPVFLSLDGQFASDGVLDIFYAWVESGWGKGGHVDAATGDVEDWLHTMGQKRDPRRA